MQMSKYLNSNTHFYRLVHHDPSEGVEMIYMLTSLYQLVYSHHHMRILVDQNFQ